AYKEGKWIIYKKNIEPIESQETPPMHTYKQGDRAVVIVDVTGYFPFKDRMIRKGDIMTVYTNGPDHIIYESECALYPHFQINKNKIQPVVSAKLEIGDRARVIDTPGSDIVSGHDIFAALFPENYPAYGIDFPLGCACLAG